MQPETSNEAHEKIKKKKSIHYTVIMDVLRFYDKPMTAGEICQAVDKFGIDKTAVSRRLPELESGGFIKRGEARPCECKKCSSRQLTWINISTFRHVFKQPEQAELFDTKPNKKW